MSKAKEYGHVSRPRSRIVRRARSLAFCTAALALCASLVLCWTVPALAAPGWGANGVQVCGAGGDDTAAQVIPDGSGGAIVTWMDNRHDPSGAHPWIYAQRLDSSGRKLWRADGVPVCGAAQITWPSAVPDGHGGAIITWGDARAWPKWQVFAQRVDAAGNVRWVANGITICNASGYGDVEWPRPTLAADGSGGAIIAWPDYRRGVPDLPDIYAQRVDGNGNTLWAVNGLLVSALPDTYTSPLTCSDGSGGAIVSYTGPHLSQFAQRIDGNGNHLWPGAGVQVLGPRPVDRLTQDMSMVPDGLGGALFGWSEDRTYHEQCYDVYCQRVTGAGKVLWKADGVPVSVVDQNDGQQPGTVCVSDGDGGTIVTWIDSRDGDRNRVWAQRVDAAGKALWARNGRKVAGGADYKALPTIATDGRGGGIINWLSRNQDKSWQPYLQRVGGDGGLLWGAAGVRPCTTPASYDYCPMASDTTGGVIVSWGDRRSGSRTDVYAQRVSNPVPSWYLAEGTNAWGFSTYITITNPNNTAAGARLTYMDPNPPANGKGIVTTRTITLPPSSQTTVSSMEDIGPVDFSTKVDSLDGATIAVDRTMFWTGPGLSASQGGYHDSIGTAAPSKTWYLPEGSSNWGFETWTLIANPGSESAALTLTYMTPDGPIQVSKTVPPNSRATYNMLSDIGPADASLQVASSVPVVAERSMYREGKREGSCSIGATAPAPDFFLAEGATGYDVNFNTYVLIQNPNGAPNDVTLTFQTQSGQVEGPSFTMLPNSRMNVRLGDHLPVNTSVSTLVHGSKPLVAERAMYWDNGTGEAFHTSVGTAEAHMTFMLPDGQTSGGCETWTLVANPNPGAVTVRVTYLPQGGGRAASFTDEIPPGTRASYSMADKGIDGRASVLVESLDGARPVVVERAMYWNARGGGTDTIGGWTE